MRFSPETPRFALVYHEGVIGRRTFLLTPLALARAAEQAPNLLLITASGWRGQAVPWAEDPDLTAPNLKKFGEQSVIFSRAYCCSPKPELAETALATSRFPHAADPHDPVLGGLETRPFGDAFKKTPFAVRISLASRGGPGPGRVHLRENVPPESEARTRGDVANFYGACKNDDAILGEVLAALDKLNLARDTIVCFTSDCGQQLGSHGIEGAEVPYEESVRIPLAIRYPRKLEARTRDLASQIDIMPTLLALRGMELPEEAQGADLFGKVPPESVFAEGKLGEEDEWRMLVRGYDKIAATPKGDITPLFNRADDPFEMTNLVRAPAMKLALASLKAALLAQMKQLRDGMDPSGLRRR